jgi:hypothetical protein
MGWGWWRNLIERLLGARKPKPIKLTKQPDELFRWDDNGGK